MEEKRTKMKKSTKYLLIGTLVLFLSVIGASVAYYLARAQGNLNGRAAGTELEISVTKLSTSATDDLIPLDNDLETLGQAAVGYENNGACIDINGYSVCQIYKVTLTNNGSVPLTVNGTVTLSGTNVPNIDCARMDDKDSITNNNSCMGGNVFVSGDALAANSSNDYYVMIYINNLDEPQYDSGEFNGTVIFTTEDGKKVKGRFTKPFNLVNHIANLYNNANKSEVVNNNITYHYATNEGLMNDRLGGTTESLDGGNIRYYGDSPNNYIDIGDKTVTDEIKANWEELFAAYGIVVNSSEECLENIGFTEELTEEELDQLDNYISEMTNYNTATEFCSTKTIPAGTPILWRIIGVFDGKLRIRRDEGIGSYSFDTSPPEVNSGQGVNEWSQADLMKLLNPGHENNSDKDYEGNDITVNNSLYWNRGSGTCYQYDNDAGHWNAMACDFTNTGLSEEAKEYVIDQTVYLGGFDTNELSANQTYQVERGNNVLDNTKSCYGDKYCNDGITRTTTWVGKVSLIYPSDYGYAADFSNTNCQGNLNTFNNCTANWMGKAFLWAISPIATRGMTESYFSNGMFDGINALASLNSWPTLLLDSSSLAESGNGSKETPYVVAY